MAVGATGVYAEVMARDGGFGLAYDVWAWGDARLSVRGGEYLHRTLRTFPVAERLHQTHLISHDCGCYPTTCFPSTYRSAARYSGHAGGVAGRGSAVEREGSKRLST